MTFSKRLISRQFQYFLMTLNDLTALIHGTTQKFNVIAEREEYLRLYLQHRFAVIVLTATVSLTLALAGYVSSSSSK